MRQIEVELDAYERDLDHPGDELKELERLQREPSAGKKIMSALMSISSTLYFEVLDTVLDTSVSDSRIPSLLKALMNRAEGVDLDGSSVWLVLCHGERGAKRVRVDVRNRRKSERCSDEPLAASIRHGDVLAWSGLVEYGNDPRVLCTVLAGRARLAVDRILPPGEHT